MEREKGRSRVKDTEGEREGKTERDTHKYGERERDSETEMNSKNNNNIKNYNNYRDMTNDNNSSSGRHAGPEQQEQSRSRCQHHPNEPVSMVHKTLAVCSF